MNKHTALSKLFKFEKKYEHIKLKEKGGIGGTEGLGGEERGYTFY